MIHTPEIIYQQKENGLNKMRNKTNQLKKVLQDNSNNRVNQLRQYINTLNEMK